jgi:predicted RNA methylase
VTAYEDAGSWSAGPDLVYGLMAEAAAARITDDLAGAVVLDAGAGTGATGRALTSRGATVASVDRSAVGDTPVVVGAF